jgi:ubiquinone/menaquinone biosynthesis C-methylase UbiE
VRFRERVIRPELLDDVPLERKRGSLADLDRLNGQSGVRPFRETLARVVGPDEAFSALDVGAASGFMGRYLQDLYPRARVASLDYRLDHLAPAPPPRVAADAFRLPFRDASFDVVYSSLFLHHFEDARVTELLRDMRRVARRAVVAIDLHRHAIPYYFVPATKWAYHWDPITVHDAPVSVEAAFRPEELRRVAVAAGLQRVETRSWGFSFRVSLIGWV